MPGTCEALIRERANVEAKSKDTQDVMLPVIDATGTDINELRQFVKEFATYATAINQQIEEMKKEAAKAKEELTKAEAKVKTEWKRGNSTRSILT